SKRDWSSDVCSSDLAGRPMTFQMDLYAPLFVPRPHVEPELYASLRPPMYQGGLNPLPGGMVGMAMGPGGPGGAFFPQGGGGAGRSEERRVGEEWWGG